MSSKASIDDALNILTYGCVDVIERDELKIRIAKSQASGKPLTVKLGADPTAPDLHLGHAVVLRKLHQFQELGHIAVFLIGDFTGMIGDPSGRSKTRPPLTRAEINANAETYKHQVGKILSLEPAVFDLRFNSEWSDKLNFADVITLCGKYTVARMLERNDFSERLRDGRPISLHELLYPLAQAYDSVALGCDVELGGQDQLFNLMVVRDIMREYGQVPEIAMTLPLLVGLDGSHKMSKSLGNYIGIFEPPEQIFGKVMSIPDALMADYYRLASGLAWNEVETIIKRIADGSLHPREAKADLAAAVVALYYDAEAAKKAREGFDKLFREKEIPEDMPVFQYTGEDSQVWIVTLVDEMRVAGIDLPGEITSRSGIRRKLAAGAFRIDGEVIQDVEARIDVSHERIMQYGKRFFVKINPKPL